MKVLYITTLFFIATLLYYDSTNIFQIDRQIDKTVIAKDLTLKKNQVNKNISKNYIEIDFL